MSLALHLFVDFESPLLVSLRMVGRVKSVGEEVKGEKSLIIVILKMGAPQLFNTSFQGNYLSQGILS